VSIICNNLLKLGKTEKSVQGPGEALDFVNEEINQVLNSNYEGEQIRDGMDIALCAVDPVAHKLYFSGAKNGVLVVRDGEIIELKGDRSAIGYNDSGETSKFTTQELALQEGDMLYTYSDGYVDQFGGPDHKKFMSRRLKEMLLNISGKSMNEQHEVVLNTFDIWKEDAEQIDDVLLIGVRI
jgi:serine phosphatase RsbU (regulator of sigma subunit)